jgi:hypothetical protein
MADHEAKRSSYRDLVVANLAGDALGAFNKIWVSQSLLTFKTNDFRQSAKMSKSRASRNANKSARCWTS